MASTARSPTASAHDSPSISSSPLASPASRASSNGGSSRSTAADSTTSSANSKSARTAGRGASHRGYREVTHRIHVSYRLHSGARGRRRPRAEGRLTTNSLSDAFFPRILRLYRFMNNLVAEWLRSSALIELLERVVDARKASSY